MTFRFTCLLVLLISFCSCNHPLTREELEREIHNTLNKQKGVFAVAFKNIDTGEELLINEKEMFHTASTMKTPVMIEVFTQVKEGKRSLSDSILIINEFKSIVDSSLYTLNPDDDSELELYTLTGKKKTLNELTSKMITVSSNLATNILIEEVGAKNVTQTMRAMGANDIQVLRGVEDGKAYELKLNNVTTAYDLMLIFEKIAKEEAVSKEASQAMTDILLKQEFNTIIPAKLPSDVKVAHKTGWFKSVNHDSGFVILPDGTRYVLILLSKDEEDEPGSIEAMASVSELIYEYVRDHKVKS